MKKIQFLFVCVFTVILSSCQSNISEEKIQKFLDGYWEIEKAELPDGTEKDYTINSTIDFFQLENKESLKGLRYKVMPQLSGEYLTNDVPETFEVKYESNNCIIEYSTNYSTWKEQLLSLSKDKMVVKSESDIIYYYKRAEPLLSIEKE